MRIIAGKYRGAKLVAPDGLHTRPTLDRAKETLFNMISFNLSDCVCLDLFAGSGQIGLEMLSRGAKNVVFVDNDKNALNCIKNNANKLKITPNIISSDVLRALELLRGQKFDIVYLDPPYKCGVYESVLQSISDNDLLNCDGFVICESDNVDGLPLSVGKLVQTKIKKVGTINFVWYTRG